MGRGDGGGTRVGGQWQSLQSFAALMFNSVSFHSTDLGGQGRFIADTVMLRCLAGCLIGNWQSYFFARFGLSLVLHYLPLSVDIFRQQ